MKTLAVRIVGAPEGQNLRELDIESGTTAAGIVAALGLQGYLLSRINLTHYFSAEDNVYSAVENGEKLCAVPPAQVSERMSLMSRGGVNESGV